MNIVEPRLQWFLDRMREKLSLSRNQSKSDWREMRSIELLQAVKRELEELDCAFYGNVGLEHIVEECADVANMAMMLADKIDSERV